MRLKIYTLIILKTLSINKHDKMNIKVGSAEARTRNPQNKSLSR